MNIAVVALGKIGLPLAVQFARRDHTVVGVDISDRVVDLVNQGLPPFPGEVHLDEYLGDVVKAGRLRATTDFSEISGVEAVVVVVPVMVDDNAVPDFRAIDAATKLIGEHVSPGTLVSYETTLPVHTTRTRFTPALEAVSGLTLGSSLFVCHSPERVFTGRVFADLRAYPKLVGGVDQASATRAVSFYEATLEFDERDDLDRPNGVWDLGSAEAAELAKLAETTYRNINIGFANELALHADEIGVDVMSVIEASNSQPFSHIHRPGIAVGGHCIPVYPKFYLSVDAEARIPAAGIAVNESMPAVAVKRVSGALGGLAGRRVAVLGIAYRGGVKETAFSGAFVVVNKLRELGAQVVVHDPMYTDAELEGYGFEPYALGDSCDAAIIQSDHGEYGDLTSDDLPAPVIFDGRRILKTASFGPGVVRSFGDGKGQM